MAHQGSGCVRGPHASIHQAFKHAGRSVLTVTTKDKLRRLLGARDVPSVSAEKACELELAGYGPITSFVFRPAPSIYDWDISHYALELKLALDEPLEVELLYVPLTDYVQHTAAPGEELSDAYLRQFDVRVGRFLDEGWLLGVVADHGMNAKPNVRYLGDAITAAGVATARIVLPITDPYVVHHAALGSACWIHVDDRELNRARDAVLAVPSVEDLLTGSETSSSSRTPRRLSAARRPSTICRRFADYSVRMAGGTIRTFQSSSPSAREPKPPRCSTPAHRAHAS